MRSSIYDSRKNLKIRSWFALLNPIAAGIGKLHLFMQVFFILQNFPLAG
jgi:hypothetical protein